VSTLPRRNLTDLWAKWARRQILQLRSSICIPGAAFQVKGGDSGTDCRRVAARMYLPRYANFALVRLPFPAPKELGLAVAVIQACQTLTPLLSERQMDGDAEDEASRI